MDYGELIRVAWMRTWRYRFLWVLGLFSGAAVGSCSAIGNGGPQFQVQHRSGELAGIPPEIDQAAVQSSHWIAMHPGAVALVIGAMLLVGFGLLVISLIAQAGMTRATTDLVDDRPTSLGRAWHAGLHFFWRYFGLSLLLIAAAIGFALLIGAGIALAIATTSISGGSTQTIVAAFWIILGVVIVLLMIPVVIGINIIVAFAQRVIVIDDVGAIAGLRTGWQLLRTHLGSSILVWVVNVGLSVAASLLIFLGAMVVAAVLALPGLILWSVAGFSTVTIGYIIVGVLAMIAAVWGMSAIANSFFWNYWTMAFVQISRSRPTP